MAMTVMEYYLLLTMCMSLLWGLFILLIGIILRVGMSQVLSSYLEDLPTTVFLLSSVNKAGQNICPTEWSPSSSLYLGHWSIIFAWLVISTGATVIVYSAAGFYAAAHKITCLQILILFAIFIASGLEYYLLQVTTDGSSSFHQAAQMELQEFLEDQYEIDTDNLFTKTLNAVMLMGECCGILGPSDFKNLTFHDLYEKEVNVFVVPPACCMRSVFNDDPGKAFSVLKECVKSGSARSQKINTQGCYPAIFSHMYDNYGCLIIIGIIILSVLEMIQVTLTVLIMFTPPPVNEAPREAAFVLQTDLMFQKNSRKVIPNWKESLEKSKNVL